MKFYLSLLLTSSLFLTGTLLVGCAKSELTSPCPDFGRHCVKQPVNGWQR